MKVLIGVDPHKASLAVAAIDEATGELLEQSGFPQGKDSGNGRGRIWRTELLIVPSAKSPHPSRNACICHLTS